MDEQYNVPPPQPQPQQGSSKKGIGVVCGLFLGIIGLLIMLCWPDKSVERDTFIKGWVIGFVISIAIGLVSTILFFTVFAEVFREMIESLPQA